jgi:hypothetical protein
MHHKQQPPSDHLKSTEPETELDISSVYHIRRAVEHQQKNNAARLAVNSAYQCQKQTCDDVFHVLRIL